jgi:hypothetical protein
MNKRIRKPAYVSPEREHRRALRAQGLCLKCEQKPALPHQRTCEDCTKPTSKYSAWRRDQGLCQCGKPALPGLVDCQYHYDLGKIGKFRRRGAINPEAAYELSKAMEGKVCQKCEESYECIVSIHPGTGEINGWWCRHCNYKMLNHYNVYTLGIE